MLIKATEPMECDNCKKRFQPLTIQDASYHCERCGKEYTLCKSCSVNARCSCGAPLNDAWTINGRKVFY